MKLGKQHTGILITAVVVLAIGIGSFAIVRSNPFGDASFNLDLSSLYEVDPALIQFEQTDQIEVDLQSVAAICVGPDDRVYVAGDRTVRIFSPGGDHLADIRTKRPPSCLVVAGRQHTRPGRIYVGVGTGVEAFDSDGKPGGSWDLPADNAILTSMAVSQDHLFLADAGNRVVLKMSSSGELVDKMGAPDRDGGNQVFNVPSSYFDIAASADGFVHVANPGMLRIETYSTDGALHVRWGQSGSAIDHFFGCCNPSHFAVLPGGEVVTSEKGVPRVKVYSQYGEFECVVAGPRQLDVAESELGDPRAVQAKAVFDVATDSQGRILVLDPRKKSVRVFTRRSPASQTEP